MKERVIQTHRLAVGYGNRSVVSEINIDMLKGQFVSILGPNGSGKTTTLRTLAGLLSPLKGAVYLNGRNISELSQSESARSLAVVLTGHLSPGLLTGFEFVSLGRYPYTDFLGRLKKEDIEKIEESLRLVNGSDLSQRYFNELSDGERQKLIFARALAQEPEVIILDEPTLHLDLKHRLELIGILQNFCRKKGITVIVSLHDVDLAMKVSDVVLLVKDGKILGYGQPDEILKEDTIARLYDLNSARFNSQLGTIELRSEGEGEEVFVVAGGGTGTPIFRFLSKNGFRITTGILHENDIDACIADSMGALVIMEDAFQEIKESSYRKAIEIIKKVEYIIDSGFPVGSLN
ncbi:MAG TPA: ABC transporter ATP-binding protein, partial [Desulfobacteraceae bacterium]|nr:ABC transporter ATP-binding protein [Desulfobacteraceae bacterium]